MDPTPKFWTRIRRLPPVKTRLAHGAQRETLQKYSLARDAEDAGDSHGERYLSSSLSRNTKPEVK
jgi:hypothetical protein